MKLPTYQGLKAVNDGRGVFPKKGKNIVNTHPAVPGTNKVNTHPAVMSEPKTKKYQAAKAKVFGLSTPKKKRAYKK